MRRLLWNLRIPQPGGALGAGALGKLAPTCDYGPLRADLIDFASYTAARNAAGVPAMTVPPGWTQYGLPIGSQFSAACGGKAMLLALELERARPWVDRRPPVCA